jgi:hypothetical protein
MPFVRLSDSLDAKNAQIVSDRVLCHTLPKTKTPRRISVAGIGDAGSKTNSMKTGIIDLGYSTNKSAPPRRGALI